MDTKENYFVELSKVKCVTDKKNKLTYVSWADAWLEVKTLYPNSNYKIYENSEGFPFWQSTFWIDVKVWVTINDIEHIVRLPVMDWANKAMKDVSYKYTTKYWEKNVEAATQFDINKAIQRAFAKAIAMHGIWLYVFRWEDLPENEETKTIKKPATKTVTDKWLNFTEFKLLIEAGNSTEDDFKRVIKEDWYKLSWKAKEAVRAYINTKEIIKY